MTTAQRDFLLSIASGNVPRTMTNDDTLVRQACKRRGWAVSEKVWSLSPISGIKSWSLTPSGRAALEASLTVETVAKTVT